jgi:DNA-binding MarR family transcriptional regulator
MPQETTTARSITVSNAGLDVLEHVLSYYIRTLNIAVSRDLDAKLEGLEVAKGTGKITTLLLVDRHPGIRPSVIAQLILRDRSAMVRLVDHMEEDGLLTRVVDEQDNRAQGLFITAKGKQLAATIRPIVAGQSREFFSDITDEEHRMLISILGRTYRRVAGLTGEQREDT